jgi:DNA-directed RNA polymerase II subunit RPB1
MMDLGFINRIKKILECVCFYCSKLKVDASNDRFARMRLIKDRKRRFHEVWELCKARNICEASPAYDPDSDGNPLVSALGHGGCGHRQPAFKKEALRLIVLTKVTRDDVSSD